MVMVPVETAVRRPAELMVATEALEDVHVARLETSSVFPSALVPVATNCSVPPTPTVGFVGERAIVTTVAFETKKLPPQAVIDKARVSSQAAWLRWRIAVLVRDGCHDESRCCMSHETTSCPILV